MECFNAINELLQNLKSIAMVHCNITAVRTCTMGLGAVLFRQLPEYCHAGSKL
jgi:hypothetical protein